MPNGHITVVYKWTANPAPFFFFGGVPDELKAATEQMRLGAEFGSYSAGFTR